MDISREELLRQKALLEEHLAWIEQKLREDIAEGAGAPKPDATKQEPSLPSLPPATPSEPSDSPQPTVAATETAQVASLPEDLAHLLGKEHAEPTTSITEREKWGCIIVAILFAAAIVAALFILPDYLYD